MKIFTCKICGEVYLGSEIPPSCPFCGAAKKFLQLPQIWRDENNVELSDISKKNLEEALKLEVSNATFYKSASKTLSDPKLRLMFKGLAKVEKEHAEVFQKLLKLEALPGADDLASGDERECVEASLKREKHAVEFYLKAAEEATEPRVKEVFLAIMEIEKDHIALDEEELAKY